MKHPYFNQFEDLTQEQRDGLRAEIFAEELIKMSIEAEKEQVNDMTQEPGSN